MDAFQQADAAHIFLSDTQTIIETLAQQPVPLTKKRQYFSYKLLHQLNDMCTHPEQGVTPKSPQYFYPYLHLMRFMLEAGGLFSETYDKKGAFFTPEPSQIEAYLQLTPKDQYIFWLKVMWQYVDLKDTSSQVDEFRKSGGTWGSTATFVLAMQDPTIEISSIEVASYFVRDCLVIWDEMGLIELEKVSTSSGKTYWSVGKCNFTPLGEAIIPFLLVNRPPGTWSVNKDEISPLESIFLDPSKQKNEFSELVEFQGIPAYMDYVFKWENGGIQTVRKVPGNVEFAVRELEKIKQTIDAKLTFEEVLAPVLRAEQIIPIKEVSISNEPSNYLIKVALKYQKSIWRTIKISSEDTFESLHLAIQEAFNFGNDNLYMFCLDKKQY
ncbi:MAG: hypothetical protein AAGI38_21855 [Bacteroidota bacterium]